MSDRSHAFDKSVQIANIWLRDISDRLLTDDRTLAYEGLRAVLHVLRDRLPLDAVMGLSAQMPLLIRGVLLEGWRPGDGPTAIRDRNAFADAVIERLPESFPASGLEVSEAVLATLSDHIDHGETRKLLAHLPPGLRFLWRSQPFVGVPGDA